MILFPHAKINIGLNILKIREDGYHEISSIFYPVKQCYDVLEITEQQHFSFVKSGIKIPDGENLCEKAFHLLKKDFSFANVEIHLYKHIPIGAGLGGGSGLSNGQSAWAHKPPAIAKRTVVKRISFIQLLSRLTAFILFCDKIPLGF